nr:RNA-directed DNA polymerase, eukaryota, reverse transcriptase zinc-binding domain protein [Tanacetum cinerariifolium]
MNDRHRSFKSNEDLTKKISHSIFVTNFPDSITSCDLWRECNAYGTMVDVFIPFKKSKAGKRFAFVRFVKVLNLELFVKNLCTIWIGRHHLYANQVRFERPQKPNFSSLNYTNRVSEKTHYVLGCRQSKGLTGSYVNAVNGIPPSVQPGSLISSSPAMVLDDSCIIERDFSKQVMGRVKDFNSIPNLPTIFSDEGFADVKLLYLGGFWVMLEFDKVETKSKLMQHTGVNSWFHVIQDVTHDFVCDERIVWVDIEGVPLYAWSHEIFSRIGNKRGETLNIEDTNDSSFGRKRLCIKTKHPVSILESFKIIVKGKVFMVRAKEVFMWNPIFLTQKEVVYSSEDESIHGEENKTVQQHLSEESGDDVSDVEGVAEINFDSNSASHMNYSRDKDKQHSKDPFGLYDILKKKKTWKDTVQDIGDIDGNFFKESSPVINAKVINNFQSVQEEEICDSGQSATTKGGSVLGVLEEVIRVGQAMGYSMEGCEKDIDDSLRNSGGILCVWEATVFKKEYVTISDNFVAIYGTWLPNNSRILFVVVYALQQVSSKRVLWDYMSVLLSRWNSEVIMMGDFNEVRSRDERRGSWFNPSSVRVFNQFISSSGLVDIKMKGYTFTWSHPSATKMSKLDRFLVSDGIFLEFPSFDGFDDMVERTWRSFSHSDGNGMIRFKKKHQELKVIIRRWIIDKRFHMAGSKIDIINELQVIDKELDQGVVSDVNLLRRLDLNRQLHDINVKEATDSFQKSKVRWAIEGDENSKFFHGIINKKRSQLTIRGVFVDGCWCTDPIPVKEAFHDHFEARFKKPITNRLKLNFPFNKRLLHDQAADLERRISRDEIRMAVWNCGENKSPGPDGFTFEFLRDTGISLSAFIAERQILDGPFILNEVLHWCKRKTKKAMFFKVDFAKAYDSVRWDYLIDVLEAFGFGPTWCKWIRGTFCFAKASVLVNGSPSNEFQFHRVLKQGDPLSPYLFILVMESLHLSFSRAVEEGLFKGICLNGSVSISHLFYADDAMFIGEWSDANLRELWLYMSRCQQYDIHYLVLHQKLGKARVDPDQKLINKMGMMGEHERHAQVPPLAKHNTQLRSSSKSVSSIASSGRDELIAEDKPSLEVANVRSHSIATINPHEPPNVKCKERRLVTLQTYIGFTVAILFLRPPILLYRTSD